MCDGHRRDRRVGPHDDQMSRHVRQAAPPDAKVRVTGYGMYTAAQHVPVHGRDMDPICRHSTILCSEVTAVTLRPILR